MFVKNAPVLRVDLLGRILSEQMFIDCFFVKVFLEAKGFWGYYREYWAPNELKKRKSSPIFNLKVVGYWKIKDMTMTLDGKSCSCKEVRKLYEDDYAFSVTVRVYDINAQGEQQLRYNYPTGFPIKTLLGTFHEQEMTSGTQMITSRPPESILAPGVVSYHIDTKNNKAIRVQVDALTQLIYDEVHPFSY